MDSRVKWDVIKDIRSREIQRFRFATFFDMLQE